MIRLEPRATSAAAEAVTALLSGGTLALYADGDRVLAEFRFGRPAFEPAEDGVAEARPIAAVSAKATGQASRFRAFAADREMILEGTVGTMRADLIISDPMIQRDAEVVIEGLIYRHPSDALESVL